MFLPLDTASGLPIYRQLMEQVRRMIAAGTLSPGDRLPSVREISTTLHINPLTVAKAYQELEHAGIVAMRRGLGVFVADAAPAAQGGGSAPGVEAAAERLVLEAVQAGLGREEVLGVVTAVWKRVRNGGTRGDEK